MVKVFFKKFGKNEGLIHGWRLFRRHGSGIKRNMESVGGVPFLGVAEVVLV